MICFHRVFRVAARVLAAFAVIQGPSALAGVNSWSSAGPLPAEVFSLAANPDGVPPSLYAAVYGNSGGGVFRSVNRGISWVPANLSISITALASGSAGTAYAGSFNNADFKTADGGASWQQMRPQHSSSAVIFIKIDPRHPSTLYLSAAGTIVNVGSPGGDLLRSGDGGLTWSSIHNGLTFGVVRDLAIDSQNPATLHAVKASGYYRSQDSGGTWTRLPNGLPAMEVTTLALDPVAPTTIYAGAASGVFKSLDGGNTFSRVGTGLPATPVTSLAIDPAVPSRLFAGTRGSGVYATADGGESWSAFNTGLANLNVTTLTIEPSGEFLHAGTLAGVFDYQFVSDPQTLVLNSVHPFRVRLAARDQRTGGTGVGLAIQQSDLFGYFSVPELTFNPENPEVFVKIIDGRALSGSFWVFYGGLTDLEYTLTVTEEATGRIRTYFKPAGSACGGFDTMAFGP